MEIGLEDTFPASDPVAVVQPVGPEFDEQRPNWPRRETVGSAASVPSMAEARRFRDCYCRKAKVFRAVRD
jgi:hypothetical protein